MSGTEERSLNMPVSVRNRQSGPAIFSEKEITIEWARFGDIDGGDIQEVPDDFLKNVNFMKALRQGIFEEVTAEAAQASYDRQVVAYRDREATEAQRTIDSVDEFVERPIATLKVDETGKHEWVQETRQTRITPTAIAPTVVKDTETEYLPDGEVREVPVELSISVGEPLSSMS